MESSHELMGELDRLRVENQRLSQSIAHLDQRFAELEAENRDFAQRLVDVETQNENLLNLYVASFQLHSTLDQSEVVQCIKEILINLIGTEEFGIYLVDEETNDLLLFGFEGEAVLGRGRIAPGEGIEGAVAIRGDSYFSQAAGRDNDVLVCIPLKIRDSVIGLISIHQLLSHKPKLSALDHELLQLLAAQAATALVSSKLYATADRKLKTMEGLMNLLRTR